MTSDETNPNVPAFDKLRRDRQMTKGIAGTSFGLSDFVLPSSFVIIHSSLRS
jgi:hypothetical protein